MSEVLNKLCDELREVWGYLPTFKEVYDAYTQGDLMLSDAQENAILERFEE